MSTRGRYTIRLCQRLTKKWGEKYDVYCGHRRNSKKSNNGQPRLYFADYSTASTLSFPDVVMIEKENRKVRIFCEIEERHAVPKTIIGDIVNIILSEKLRIKDDIYDVYDEDESPQLILGIIVTEGGKSEPKANDLIDRLKSAIKEQYWNKMDDIKIIYGCDKDTLINNVESEIRSILELKQRDQHI